MKTYRLTAMPSGATSMVWEAVGQVFRRGPVALAAIVAAAALSPAHSQSNQVIVKQGYAVVTGYSGFVSYPAPDGADQFDYLTINTEGPSARVVDLSNLGPQGGGTSPAPKPFTVTAAQVGQVFGAALDNSPQRNFYLAATSAYGVSIYTTDDSGALKRLHKGAPGAQFVPGTFGPPELGGGPGSIWRVSGVSGDVSLLTTIDSATGGVASLGALAFDPATQQIFAADRSSGLIYRLGLDGTISGTYDHGVEGRPSAGLSPVPMAAALPVNIESPAFDTGNPKTWGFTAPARRVFGLAVFNKRLYYSVAQGPQIWSAAIAAGGSVSGARLEVEVPSLGDGIEISSITFDSQGRMYLAERGPTAGDYSLYQLASGGQSRVLRYLPKPAGDPAPGRWKLLPDQYSVGMPPDYNNADGGVALNYGYGQTGKINPGACGATVWSTGERLLDPGDGSEGFDTVDGLQGNAISLVQPQNVPPSTAWFVDYDDQPGDANFRGYMGAIATNPCAAPVPQVPPPVVCPAGTYYSDGQCLIFPTCPPGTKYQNGQCVYPQCPPGFVRLQNQCVPPPETCPPGSVYYQGQCVPLDCPPGLERTPNGYCSCPQGTFYLNGKCVPPQQCPPNTIKLPGGICFCPLGLLQNGKCTPFQCPQGQVLNIEGQCEPVQCPQGQQYKNGQCQPIACPPNKDLFNGQCVNKCPPLTFRQPDGSCKPILIFCAPPKQLFNGQCLDPCPKFTSRQPDGSCKPLIINPPIFCLAPKEPFNGQCVNPCPPLQQHTMPNGVCKPKFVIDPGPIQIFCLAPKEPFNGQCVNPCPPLQQHTMPNGVCKPKFVIDPGPIQIFCPAPKEVFNGQCLNPCPKFSTRQPDGSCKSLIIQPLPILCVAPNEMVNGACVPPCDPPTVRKPDGSCGLKFKLPLQKLPLLQICLAPKEMVNGACVDPCPQGQVRANDGSCVLKLKVLPGLQLQIQPNP